MRAIAALLALALAAGAAARSVAQEAPPPVATQGAAAVELADAPGGDKVVQCGACHSLDYIRMNSRFLDLAGWTAVVNKMIKAFGAPIRADDVEAIARYLAEHYGRPETAP